MIKSWNYLLLTRTLHKVFRDTSKGTRGNNKKKIKSNNRYRMLIEKRIVNRNTTKELKIDWIINLVYQLSSKGQVVLTWQLSSIRLGWKTNTFTRRRVF